MLRLDPNGRIGLKARDFFEWPADYGVMPMWRRARDRKPVGPTAKRSRVKAARKANLARIRRNKR